MPNTTDTLSGIEVAREKIGQVEARPLIDVARETAARKQARMVQVDPRYASAYVAGYEARDREVASIARQHEVYQDSLLSRTLAEEQQVTASLRAQIAELEAQLEQCKTVITEANNSLYGSHGFFLGMEGGFDKQHLSRPIEDLKQALRQKAVGVGVDDEMAKVFANKYWYNEAWKSFETLDAIKDAIAAALTSAHPVPLVSVEVAMYETSTRGTTPMRTPLFRGFSEPAQRGEG